MITLEQHLEDHMYLDTYDGWESCECGWREEQERLSEGSIFTHAAHVAATWREAQADVIDRAKSMLSTIDYARSARVSPAYPDGAYRRMIADLLTVLTGEVQS